MSISDSSEPIVLTNPPNPTEAATVFNSLQPHELARVPPLILNTAFPKQIIYPKMQSSLMIGTVLAGKVTLGSKRELLASPKTYHIFNTGKLATEPEDESAALRICFKLGFAEEILGSLILPTDVLLEDPTILYPQPVFFLEDSYKHDRHITPLLEELEKTTQNNAPIPDSGFLLEKLHILLERLLFVHREMSEKIRRLPMQKRSTQIELYRRINRARDFIEDHPTKSLSLGQIANTAALSKHHFLRNFKAVFGQTPYQYGLRRRLEHAHDFLLKSSNSITEVAYHFGFEDLSRFQTLFRRHFGMPPGRLRKK